MLRTVLLIALVAATSFACAPHKPKRPKHHHHHHSGESHESHEASAKECKPLTKWEKTACEATLNTPPTECVPIKSSPLEVSCDMGYTLKVKGSGAQAFGEAGPVSCDKATQEWSYTYGGVKKTEAELITQLQGGPLMFTCTKPK